MSDSAQSEISQYKTRVGELFGRAATTYDRTGPQFFSYFGERLVDLAEISSGSRILDIATGRGAILFPAVKQTGPQGEVIGIDISEPMVHETQVEIKNLELKNAYVKVMDAEHLQFPDNSFDNVFCGLSIFIFPQPLIAISEMWRVLKPGGELGLSTFWEDDERWKWLGELFRKYLPPSPDVDSTQDEDQEPAPDFRSHDGMKAFMESIGFEDIRIKGEELDFLYSSEDEWWSTIWSHGMRGTLEQILESGGETTLHEFKLAAFENLQTVKQPDGFPHAWSVLFTLGRKPQT
jgi:ubiquinone/menaquinone biosynthesis C-methylase UbiE